MGSWTQSPASCVAMLYLSHECDIAGNARAHHPDLTDEQVALLLARARELDATAYRLCERDRGGEPLRDNAEILAELARAFPEHPRDVLGRAMNNGHQNQLHG